ncbi:hypothetical protein BGX34_004593 [Mortierella sp. NVP85]|nr:hypothetical protein BGX34_004593 [Mortierella sp. NVP85]
MAFSSAWLGSIVCFYFCRRWFKVHVRKLMTKNKSLKAVVRTVEKKGFRLLLLIRLAPYPFNIMNALLSATHIPLYTFALATGLSLLKLMLFVYIGSTLSSLAGNDGDDDDTPKNPDEAHGHRLQKVAMILGIILGIGVGGYVWLVASREVEKSEALRIERRRRRREAGLRRALNERLGLDFASSGGTGIGHGGHGIELTDQNYGLGSDLGREDASLFDRLETGRGESGQATTTGWRDVVDMGGDSFADSGEEEDSSDSFDDDDDEEEEEEEEDDGDQDAFLGGLGGRSGYRSVGQSERQDARNREDEELDFSAHFTGLDHSPWQEDETVDATDTADAGFEATTDWPSIDPNADPESIDNDDDGRGR